MEHIIEIDGAAGGGGILRACIALSLGTGKPFHIRDIGARRPRRGLMRRDLAIATAASALCDAEVAGDEVGSSELLFVPGKPCLVDQAIALPTGGSIALALQAIACPAAALASGKLEISLTGSTWNGGAPGPLFMTKALWPLLESMGYRMSLRILRDGFGAIGGGKAVLAIEGAPAFKRLEACSLPDSFKVSARIACCRLDEGIARREEAVLKEMLGLERVEIDLEHRADGSGNGVEVEVAAQGGPSNVFGAVGAPGTAAEAVASTAAAWALEFMRQGVPVGRFLAEQLLVPLALGAGGEFVTGKPEELFSGIAKVVRKFTKSPVKCQSLGRGSGKWLIGVEGLRNRGESDDKQF